MSCQGLDLPVIQEAGLLGARSYDGCDGRLRLRPVHGVMLMAGWSMDDAGFGVEGGDFDLE